MALGFPYAGFEARPPPQVCGVWYQRRPGKQEFVRRVIRERIRREAKGINLAADIDAVISINTGRDAETTRTHSRSSHSVVQGEAGQPGRSQESPIQSDKPPKEKT